MTLNLSVIKCYVITKTEGWNMAKNHFVERQVHFITGLENFRHIFKQGCRHEKTLT